MLYDTVEEMLHIFLTSALGGKGIFTRGKTILVLPWNKALHCITPNMGLAEFRTPDIQTVASHFTVPILVPPWNKALPCITPNMGLAEFGTPDIQTVAGHLTVPSTPVCGAAKQTSCLQKKVLILKTNYQFSP